LSVIARTVRNRVRVEGTVQGVGFRPYVYRLARELELAGYVLNDAHGVLLEVEGDEDAVREFLHRLEPEAPPLAVLERLSVSALEPSGAGGFEIELSPRNQTPDAPITPDTATCADCLGELFDPADRRFRYPFINCTNCGPRFTIVRGVPYDRPFTTMAEFRMCAECRREYEDPLDRRFHAQPNACSRCGPSVALLDAGGRAPDHVAELDAVAAAARALAKGQIVALKGIGGYHLACLAEDDRAVARLRARKHREDKPFALMAPDLETVERLIAIDTAARELLISVGRPIVLAPRRSGEPVALSVAPGAPELGVMLPYSPLHHLLLRDVGRTLVMTSGNVSDEPIAFRDDDARQRLARIADLFLVHDRPIETRTDDSVIRSHPRTTFLRRSRGYVPAAIGLPGDGVARPLLACGAELKNTFCVAKGSRAWVSHHIGDLENLETLRSFEEGIAHFERLFAVDPEVVAYDLHPEYLSTKYALGISGVELVGVQHHHAHLVACLAEHGEAGAAVGAIFDGTGYGLDGTIWGGELLVGDLASFRRVGELHPVRMPGGAQAIKQPWRMACAWLAASGRGQPPRSRVDPARWGQITVLAESGLASPITTSAGRLFDAVAALCGVRDQINYEGQAAIELEARCDPAERGAYEIVVDEQLVMDPRRAIVEVADAVAAGEAIGTIAARFHNGFADATVAACSRAAVDAGTEVVVLSGGVFANRWLLQRTSEGLVGQGLRVLFPQHLPPGDGGISYGQAAVAAARMRG
jgi:hydrogenase maturation protein HypF